MRRQLALLAAAVLAASTVSATGHYEPKKLAGTYSIGTASLTDPAPGESSDALLRLYLTGDAAKDLFKALRAKPERDECFDDGTMTKVSGELLCARHPSGSHECWIGVNIESPSLAPAFVC